MAQWVEFELSFVWASSLAQVKVEFEDWTGL